MKDLLLVTNHFGDKQAIYYNGKLMWEGEGRIRLMSLIKDYPDTLLGNINCVVLTEECTNMLDSDGSYPEFADGLEFNEEEIYNI